MKLPINNYKKQQTKKLTLGLDLGSSCIKLVVLESNSGGTALINYVVALLPPGKTRRSNTELSAVIKDLIVAHKLAVNNVNLSLAGKATIVRDIWVPQMSAEELATSIKYELDQYIPFPVEDVYHDSYILDESEVTRKEGQMRIVLAVAKRKVVDDHLQSLQTAGCQVNAVSVDAVVLANSFSAALSEEQKKETYAVVDIGVQKIIINILAGGLLLFTREVGYGTIKVIEGVSRGLSVARSEAEKLIIDRDTQIEGWIQDLASRLSKEMWNSIEYFEGQEHRNINKVYICGGGSLLPGLADSLSQAIGIAVEVWNPLLKLKIDLDSDKAAQLQRMAPLMAIALGLAYQD